MTNQEVLNTLKEIGRIRYEKRIRLYEFDAWFLFGISMRVNNALLLTAGQKRYLLLVLYKIKNDKYIKTK